MRALLAFSIILLGIQHVKAQENVLAMAYCNENDAVGVSVKPEEYHATQLALKSCLFAGGSVECCKIQVLIKSARCGAIAVNDDYFGEGKGDSIEDAIEEAKRTCGNGCRVLASRCRY